MGGIELNVGTFLGETNDTGLLLLLFFDFDLLTDFSLFEEADLGDLPDTALGN